MAVTPVDTRIQVPPPDPAPAEPPNVAVTPCAPPKGPYYLDGGLRRVKPYHFTYNTFCKERWRDRELVEIFTSEFRDRAPEYYRNALEAGSVTVNGKVATPNTVIRNGQVISHTLHRHEPPVTGLPVGVIHEDNDLLVIDKPPGVPVHAAGRYHYNSVVEILRAERGFEFNPRPCNRLDRLTSGVMFIGKHPKAAEGMSMKLKQRTLRKEYVARVAGRFPDGVLVCDQPIMSVSPKLGLNRVRATGKEAKTKFRRLAYYPPSSAMSSSTGGEEKGAATPPAVLANEQEGYSIVHCLPLTGRTHQIRVHLQFLGHPISNDPIYSNRKVFGPGLGRNDTSADRDDEIIDRLNTVGKSEIADPSPPPPPAPPAAPSSTTPSYRTHLTAAPSVPPGTDPAVVEEIMSREHEAAVADYHKRKGEKLSGEICDICGTELYTDPGPHDLGIFLHAVAYADNEEGWQYRSKMPSWALPPVGEDGPVEVPDWDPSVMGIEEVVIGHGIVPEGIGEDHHQLGRDDVPALVQGVGMVDISTARRDGSGGGAGNGDGQGQELGEKDAAAS